MAAQFNARHGTETLICDVIVVLNIAAFLRQWVVRGEGFGSKYKPYFSWEMAEEFVRSLESIICLFCRRRLFVQLRVRNAVISQINRLPIR